MLDTFYVESYDRTLANYSIEKHNNYSRESKQLVDDLFAMMFSNDLAELRNSYEQVIDQLERVYEMRCELIGDGLCE